MNANTLRYTLVGVGFAVAVASSANAMSAVLPEAVIAPVGAGTSSIASPIFDINIVFGGGLTSSQQAVFTAAEYFWESMITGYQIAFTDGSSLVTGPTITAQGAAIDGAGGTNGNVLGQAGPNTAYVVSDGTNSFAYTATGTMTFDTYDLPDMEASGTFFDVIVHEMGHVLGFGTLWNTNSFGGVFAGTQSVYTNGTGQYTGAYGVTAYNAEFGNTDAFVPVELDGGTGTANGHWDEVNFAGGSLDLMTGFIGSPNGSADAPFAAVTLSATTIASFADIGYTTVVTHAIAPVPLPAGLGLGLMALGGLFGVTRRRKGAV
ncbi:hypothetical protein [Tropicibacter sp. S64]|uniref:hypothetical protein n=1 Tax=Tropicibacter sp. S64 TaxID=3415122 RepID=UPI003C7D8310